MAPRERVRNRVDEKNMAHAKQVKTRLFSRRVRDACRRRVAALFLVVTPDPLEKEVLACLVDFRLSSSTLFQPKVRKYKERRVGARRRLPMN